MAENVNQEKINVLKNKLNNITNPIDIQNIQFNDHPNEQQLNGEIINIQSLTSQERYIYLANFLNQYNDNINENKYPQNLSTISSKSIQKRTELLNSKIKKLSIN